MAVTVVIDSNTYVFDIGRETIVDKEKLKEKYGDIDRLNTVEQKEYNLSIFIEDIINLLDDDSTFEEEFVEIPISGKYLIGEDGTEVVTSSGGKKVYVKYKKQ